MFLHPKLTLRNVNFLLKLTPHIDQSFLLEEFEMKKMSQIKVKHDNVKSSEYLYVKMFFYLDIYSMASFLYLKSYVYTTRVVILRKVMIIQNTRNHFFASKWFVFFAHIKVHLHSKYIFFELTWYYVFNGYGEYSLRKIFLMHALVYWK